MVVIDLVSIGQPGLVLRPCETALVFGGWGGDGGVSGMKMVVVCLQSLGITVMMVLGGMFVVCLWRTIYWLGPVWGQCGRGHVMALMVVVLMCGVYRTGCIEGRGGRC
jgi:hypothetical protein